MLLYAYLRQLWFNWSFYFSSTIKTWIEADEKNTKFGFWLDRNIQFDYKKIIDLKKIYNDGFFWKWVPCYKLKISYRQSDNWVVFDKLFFKFLESVLDFSKTLFVQFIWFW